MRRVTIELDLDEMGKFENNPMLEKVKSLEILQFLKDGPEEFAAIFRIEFKDQTSKVEDFVGDDILELQMLDHGRGVARPHGGHRTLGRLTIGPLGRARQALEPEILQGRIVVPVGLLE